MELKYCERCGTLGLRQGGSSQVYCESCEEKMDEVCKARPAQRAKETAQEPDEAREVGLAKKGSKGATPLFAIGGGDESLAGGRWA
jgi:uncharacterized Zn finger protein (UPF0148 family)